MANIKKYFSFLCWLLSVLAGLQSLAQDTSQQIVPNRKNSKQQQQKPYVILISADGFRYDFADKYHAENLLRLRKQGVLANSMIPCFPSLTFPNHYSIITGQYPAHNGLIENLFYDKKRKQHYKDSYKPGVADGSWYGGKPLWNLAEQQQMLAASFYWVAAEANIENMHQTYYYHYNSKIPIDDRIQVVKQWLQLPPEKRPHLITFYLPQVDHEAHNHGPESLEAAEAVRFIDESIGKLVASIDSLSLPVNYIFTADHGMTTVDNTHPMLLPACVDSSKFIIPNGTALLQLYAKNDGNVNPTYLALQKQAGDNYEVFLKKDLPARWHYGSSDDRYNRVGDILLVPKLPNIFSLNGRPTTPGKHGFDPAIRDMQAIFMAWGPAFKTGIRTGSFENIHIYPLVAHILGLRYTHAIDGKLSVLQSLLQ